MFGEVLPKAIAESLVVSEEHPVFKRVAASGHADLMTVEREMDEKKGRRRADIVVGGVRGVGRFLSMTAGEGGWRVVIIDAADEMNRNAANAVLKVLEEPPAKAILLLVCHNPGRLLPTIRSRCRKLSLKPLEEPLLRQLIKQQIAIDDQDAEILARISEGSIGRAVGLAEEGGLEYFAKLMDLLEGLPRLSTKSLHGFGDSLARKGAEESFRTFTDLLRWWLGRLVMVMAKGQGSLQPVSEQENRLLQRLASATTLDQALEVWEKVGYLFSRAGGGSDLDRKQVVLNAFSYIESAFPNR